MFFFFCCCLFSLFRQRNEGNHEHFPGWQNNRLVDSRHGSLESQNPNLRENARETVVSSCWIFNWTRICSTKRFYAVRTLIVRVEWSISLPWSRPVNIQLVTNIDISMERPWTYSGLTTVLRALVAHFSLFVVKQASALWCTSGRAVHDTLLLDRATAVECEVVNWTHFREEKIYEKRIFPRSRKPRKLGGLLKLTKEGARRLIRTNKGFSQVERLQRDDVAVFEWDRERNGCWWLSVRGGPKRCLYNFFSRLWLQLAIVVSRLRSNCAATALYTEQQ